MGGVLITSAIIFYEPPTLPISNRNLYLDNWQLCRRHSFRRPRAAYFSFYWTPIFFGDCIYRFPSGGKMYNDFSNANTSKYFLFSAVSVFVFSLSSSQGLCRYSYNFICLLEIFFCAASLWNGRYFIVTDTTYFNIRNQIFENKISLREGLLAYLKKKKKSMKYYIFIKNK